MQAQRPCETALAAAMSEKCPQCHQVSHACMQADDHRAIALGCSGLFTTKTGRTMLFGRMPGGMGAKPCRSRFGLVSVSFRSRFASVCLHGLSWLLI